MKNFHSPMTASSFALAACASAALCSDLLWSGTAHAQTNRATSKTTSVQHLNAPSSASVQQYTSDAAGFMTNSFWYDTGKEVVVFDAQFTEDLAKKLLAEIREQTASPVKYLVITHPNPDKFNGASVFRAAGAKVVASKATAEAIPEAHAYKKYYFTKIAKMFTEANYPSEAVVDITFSGNLALELEAGRVHLHELEHSGVSTTQTVAHIPPLKALVVGDLVHHKAHAWLEGGISDGKPRPSISNWKLALSELTIFSGTTVYGGRGQSVPVTEAIRAQQQYLSRMDALVSDYIQGLGKRQSELDSASASGHFKQLAAKASEAFPDYELPFMVEYGVYGLANSKRSAQ